MVLTYQILKAGSLQDQKTLRKTLQHQPDASAMGKEKKSFNINSLANVREREIEIKVKKECMTKQNNDDYQYNRCVVLKVSPHYHYITC